VFKGEWKGWLLIAGWPALLGLIAIAVALFAVALR
jgi:hypothetical protein